MLRRLNTKSQKGATLVEFSIGATVFLTGMFAIVEFGRALWTHNALSDAARRAARYAINQPASTPAGIKTTGTDVGPSITAIKNVAVYGDPNGGTTPMVIESDMVIGGRPAQNVYQENQLFRQSTPAPRLPAPSDEDSSS